MLTHLRSGKDLPDHRWKRSSHSTGANNCLEMAVFGTGVLAIRDSKNPEGPALIFKASAWTAFLDSVRGGGFTAPSP